MKTKPIELARNEILRFSHAALKRAAMRARETARATNTALVISRNGRIEYVQPEVVQASQLGVREPSVGYQVELPPTEEKGGA